jgi:hypothetical protein
VSTVKLIQASAQAKLEHVCTPTRKFDEQVSSLLGPVSSACIPLLKFDGSDDYNAEWTKTQNLKFEQYTPPYITKLVSINIFQNVNGIKVLICIATLTEMFSGQDRFASWLP